MAKKYENMGDKGAYEEEPKKKKRFTLNPFENMYKKDGKGVGLEELHVLEKPNLRTFFKLLRRKLNYIFSVNILMVAGNFPLLFALFAIAYTLNEALAPNYQIYSALQGVAYFDNSPPIMSLLGIYGLQDSVSVFTTASYVFLGLSALVLFTFGPVNVGTTYILRNIVREEPVFVWSDFWYAVKRNIKQGILFGIIDLAMIAVLAFDMLAYRINILNSTLYFGLYILSFGMMIMYFFIRMYAYPMIVTFDMSLWKIFKNSIYFSVLGIKRNVMALLGTVILFALDFYLMRVFLPIGLILPFIILLGLAGFMCNYASFPKIKQIMIDPYYKEVESAESNPDTVSEKG